MESLEKLFFKHLEGDFKGIPLGSFALIPVVGLEGVVNFFLLVIVVVSLSLVHLIISLIVPRMVIRLIVPIFVLCIQEKLFHLTNLVLDVSLVCSVLLVDDVLALLVIVPAEVGIKPNNIVLHVSLQERVLKTTVHHDQKSCHSREQRELLGLESVE